ncbi:MAG: glycerate kinase [Myxococcales bacterium]|nr:glycerate kinase [Myxococcales bacterium]
MRVLVAPDKLKGCLTSVEAAAALARGAGRVPDVTTDLLPLADGGEGTLDVLRGALGGSVHQVQVMDALGTATVARLGFLGAGGTALVESAEAVGLARLGGQPRSVLESTSYGVGQLIVAALDAGVARVIVALGGSATNDGGLGALQALGLEIEGVTPPFRARDLFDLGAIDRGRIDPRLARVELVALADVASPLTGERGASLVFGPQKGATASEARRLDDALVLLARRFDADPSGFGMGAAGGLGFALAVLGGARVVGGGNYVLDAVGFDTQVAQTDLVLTAEGSLDAQTLTGKLLSQLGRRAQRFGVPVIVIAGRLEVPAQELANHGFFAAVPLSEPALELAESIRHAPELLAARAEECVGTYKTATDR